MIYKYIKNNFYTLKIIKICSYILYSNCRRKGVCHENQNPEMYGQTEIPWIPTFSN